MKKVVYIIGPSVIHWKDDTLRRPGQEAGARDAAYVREVARRVMLKKGYSRDTIANLQMQTDIMEAHFDEEDKALDASDLVVCDRSALDPIVYAILTSTSLEEKRARQAKLVESDSFQAVLTRYREPESIVVLLAPVNDWIVDDGVRSIENQRECMMVFQSLLDDLSIPYRTLGADSKFLLERVVALMGFARL